MQVFLYAFLIMKLTWKQIEPFVKSPDPKARVVLIYGPDDGLMRERAVSIGKTIVEDLDDPFNVVALTTDILAEDPARLQDEAKAMSMMGGSRLIRVDGASDKLTPLLKEYLEDPSSENLIILQAGELGPRSSLRQLCEKSKQAAALPCYVEDERGMGDFIRTTLSNNGYRIDHDAAQYLTANIMGDRARARSEVEKLMLYMGEEKNIKASDVQEACGEAGTGNLDELIYAVAGSNPKSAMMAYHKLIGEGVADVVILRTLQNHFRRLHYVGSLMQEGQNIDEAVKSLQPPLFFKVQSAFKSQVNKWRGPKLNMVMSKLQELEAQTKTTGMPVQTLCAQAILSLSVMR